MHFCNFIGSYLIKTINRSEEKSGSENQLILWSGFDCLLGIEFYSLQEVIKIPKKIISWCVIWGMVGDGDFPVAVSLP